MALSKLYTAKIIADMIRGIVKELEETELQPEEVLTYVNLAQQMVYNELPESDYYNEIALTESSDEVDISAKSTEKILKVVDATNGVVTEKSLLEFDELEDDPSKQKRVYYTKIGEKLKLYLGDQVTAYGSLTMTYVKKLTPCETEASYLDVKDRYVSKVIEIAKQLVYEQLGRKAE